MRKLLRKWSVAVGIVSLACSGGELTAPISQSNNQNIPATVVITPPSSPDLVIGSSVSLPISVKNASGQDITSLTVTWSSSDASVASVSPAGVVTAISAGTAIITATVGTRSAAVTINVRAAGPPPVTRVTVTVLSTLQQDDSTNAIAAAFDASGNAITGHAVTWSSRKSAIARVSATG